MINESILIIAAFAIGWWCHAVLLRLGKPVQRQRLRRPAKGPPVQL